MEIGKRIFICLVLFLVFMNSCQNPGEPEVNIIPQPDLVKPLKGQFTLSNKTIIEVSDEESHAVARYLQKFIKANSGIETEIFKESDSNKTDNIIYLSIRNNEERNFSEEGYQLSINSKLIQIYANDRIGLFWGVQSLIQLLPSSFFNKENRIDQMEISGIHIEDHPRFGYRGMHLDVGRHMFPLDFIKKYIDLLAFYKFNTFHWHLTEDQGWRIEIKKYPKLMEVAAFRDSTLMGNYRDKPRKWDGKRYGGYYTQDEIRKIVRYAADRNITIIPEIEMPGHSLAALSAYPELSCTGGPFRPATLWGVFEDVYCPKEETFSFLEDVLMEVMSLFPGEYIHIGGDECPKTRWKNCEHCQQLMKSEGLGSEEELQSYFIRRIERFLNQNGRKLIGWDEFLEGGLSPNATVMSWRGIQGGIEAAKQGHNAIMTPGSHCYFDHYQDSANSQPLAIGGLTTLKKVYHYEPIPEELNEKQAKYILGAQANVWTEYLPTSEHVEYMILPRMAALAEVNWTQPERKSWDTFKANMQHHFRVYDAMGLEYYPVIRE